MKPQILERLETMAGERGMFVDVRFGVRPSRTPSLSPPPAPSEDAPAPTVEEAGGGAKGVVPLRDRPAIPPAPIPEAPRAPGETGLTIRERAARRLANWSENGKPGGSSADVSSPRAHPAPDEP